jgi:hypothetical protein
MLTNLCLPIYAYQSMLINLCLSIYAYQPMLANVNDVERCSVTNHLITILSDVLGNRRLRLFWLSSDNDS